MNGNATQEHAEEQGAGGVNSLPPLSAHAAAGSVPLRGRIQAIIRDEDLSQTQVAREAGIASSQLSQWLGERYAGDNTKIEAKLVAWLRGRGERLSAQALAPQAPGFFDTRTAGDVMAALRYAQNFEDMVAVAGVPGIGKSTSCRQYASEYANVWVASMAAHTTGVVPVLLAISDAVGAGHSSGAARLARDIGRKVRGSKGLLIIDEAHHLQPAALDAIRALHDDTEVAVALVGGPELATKLERMPQLFSRMGMRLHLTRTLKSDAIALLDAWNVRDREERQLLLDVARRPGALRACTKILRLASATAASEGGARTAQHVRDAALMLSARATEDESNG